MCFGVRAQEFPVRGHDLGGQEVVDREPILAHEVADAASQRDSPNAYRAGVPKARREAVGSDCGRVLARGQASLGPRGSPFDVDLEALHAPEVEHDPPSGGAVAGAAVAAATDGELEPAVAREPDDA